MPDALAPDGSQIYLRVTDATRASLVEVVLVAGGVSRPVHHLTVEEIWYMLEGSGDVWLRSPNGGRGVIHHVEPGSTLTIPTGWDFQFRAGPRRPLRFLCFTSPPWPGDAEAAPAEGSGGLGPPTV